MFDTLNVQNCVISTENYIRKMYRLSEFVKKTEYVKCTELCKFNRKLCTLDI